MDLNPKAICHGAICSFYATVVVFWMSKNSMPFIYIFFELEFDVNFMIW